MCVESVCDMMSYITLRGRRCDIIVLNVDVPAEDRTDDRKDSLCEDLGCVFDTFPKYHMNVLLQDFNAKAGGEDIFKPTIGNENLHRINNDNGIREVHFATSKNITINSTTFPHRN
jgi:hypothetical protein